MTDKLDLSEGWCCDGRTWEEHSKVDGHCCQPKGTTYEQLPPEGKAAARQRIRSGKAPKGK